jgi:hypothetical protein
MLHSFSQPIGLLWAKRDAQGRIVDFEFGYGSAFRFTLPREEGGRDAAQRSSVTSPAVGARHSSA